MKIVTDRGEMEIIEYIERCYNDRFVMTIKSNVNVDVAEGVLLGANQAEIVTNIGYRKDLTGLTLDKIVRDIRNDVTVIEYRLL